MAQSKNNNLLQDNDIQKVIKLVKSNYKYFISSLVITFGVATLINIYLTPVYMISSSLLIKEDQKQGNSGNVADFLNSSLFGKDQNFQNELWVLKSAPVIEQTIRNLDLVVTYYRRDGIQDVDAYKDAPFKILYSKSHIQPVNVLFDISFQKGGNFQLKAKSKKVAFFNLDANKLIEKKENWVFEKNGKFGKLIESPDLAFIVELDSTKMKIDEDESYRFEFIDIHSLADALKKKLEFNVIDKLATVIEINFQSESLLKGTDVVNELMAVYSAQNLDRKNHIASTSIDYIEKQLNEISDSLSHTEDNLQSFRSSNQVLNVTEQATGISTQYMDLQNKKAELVTRKRYYDYVFDYISKNNDFSNMIVPASMGITDQMLNDLMSGLIAAQAQRSNLIENKQVKNPLVNKLSIKIENIKKTITENITALKQTTDISIDEMNKRIGKTEGEISRLPRTQRRLGGIERKYRLNDAIYNYLLEKRAEAKITKASNLPDAIIIEPANQFGTTPISPDDKLNYIIAFILGLGLPFGYLMGKSALNNKIETQETIERLTDIPVLGKIIHNSRKTSNVVFEYPKSTISESYRVLRTNIDFYLKGGHNKVIMVTSCIEGEGKSFNAMNIAMSYAQLGRKTILLDFDLRKTSNYFNTQADSLAGLSSYLINDASLKEIILKSPDAKLDYICSGPIPPNPAELLALDKTGKLIQDLKESYDYIILDTPPIAQVTDGFLLMENADIKIVIVRYNYSKKSIFSTIMKDLRQKNVNNVCIVLNDNRVNVDQYGYGYGYKKQKK